MQNITKSALGINDHRVVCFSTSAMKNTIVNPPKKVYINLNPFKTWFEPHAFND